MEFKKRLDEVIAGIPQPFINPARRVLIKQAVQNREALVSASGALATWTPPESTGRSPKDTLTVRRDEIVADIDWDSPNNLPLEPDTFDMIVADALDLLKAKERVFVSDRVVGADSSYALSVRTVSDRAITALFADTMFRPVPADIAKSIFARTPFTMVVLPYDKLDKKRYAGRLRKLADGTASDMVVAMDFVNHLGVIVGSAYMGSVKKLMFTVMNYLLPGQGILPLHTSANEAPDGGISLFLGLSGTGKTTLAADPIRSLLGDDEHGWSDKGIANFEFGCYAKLINLNPAKEPEIYRAIMHEAGVLKHGAIVENALIYPNGHFDFFDSRLTENSRGSFPLRFLANTKKSSKGGHPRVILFLTADANGVLPPVARLDQDQAMFWFLMGYTSKLAGTETGVKEPSSTFSRFFGQPFMPRNPDVYATMLGEKLRRHNSQVFLVNTGWSGGPYGEGRRMDIHVTRAIVNAALSGELQKVAYDTDPLFHIQVPRSCPGVPADILHPANTWKDKDAFQARARKLAAEFNASFAKSYGNKNIPAAICKQCPGQ